MLTESRVINILGTNVQVDFKTEKDDQRLEELLGYFDSSKNLIVVKIPEPNHLTVGNIENLQEKVLRHEIIHAFLYESGLDWSSAPTDCWATNEEMVDWLAIQTPKIFKIFVEQKLV